jgi:hypothetical protein
VAGGTNLSHDDSPFREHSRDHPTVLRKNRQINRLLCKLKCLDDRLTHVVVTV